METVIRSIVERELPTRYENQKPAARGLTLRQDWFLIIEDALKSS